ncbi:MULTISPECIES: hypothetical protein [unclassified Actinomyces]|uniref:hypothetical protein n=1 Tax=unclassified Actinomyces TaxID=2609248 RepID=UPI001373A338|nr:MULTISPECIES: hypothetical protein [unclassified Actinomyces]NDR52917.1 hypothetical protein [Actinomyces sp. 565]QHO91284.1 hypothetical protein CWT12_08125 [Actinomyces sp. 432]
MRRALTAVTAAVLVIICASALSGRLGLTDDTSISAGSASPTVRTVNPVVEPPAQTGCSTTTVLDTPALPTGWAEKWRLDSGRGELRNTPSWWAFSAGDCLVIASNRYLDTPAQVTGYRLTDAGPVQLWTRSGDDYDGEDISRLYFDDYSQWWGGYLVARRLLLDPSTGDLTQAPWAGKSGNVTSVAEEVAVVCRSAYGAARDTTCSAWDWNGGAPSQRWERSYEEDSVYPIPGYGPGGNTEDGLLLAQVNIESRSTRAHALLSLADGSLHGNWPASSSSAEVPSVFIPARDGWLRLSDSRDQATLITSSGQEGEPFPVINEPPTVVLANDGLPMLAQLRAAYRDGDFEWADVILQCRSTSACILNDNEIDLPDGVLMDDYLQGASYQVLSMLTADGGSLLIRSRPVVSAWAVVLDTESGQALVPERSRASRGNRGLARMSDDLILVLVGSDVVAYMPAQ